MSLPDQESALDNGVGARNCAYSLELLLRCQPATGMIRWWPLQLLWIVLTSSPRR
jgi:hypothetical protein